jgi:hypothetical protein
MAGALELIHVLFEIGVATIETFRVTATYEGPLEGCGHIPHREYPTRILRDVAHLLAQCDVVRLSDPSEELR